MEYIKNILTDEEVSGRGRDKKKKMCGSDRIDVLIYHTECKQNGNKNKNVVIIIYQYIPENNY